MRFILMWLAKQFQAGKPCVFIGQVCAYIHIRSEVQQRGERIAADFTPTSKSTNKFMTTHYSDKSAKTTGLNYPYELKTCIKNHKKCLFSSSVGLMVYLSYLQTVNTNVTLDEQRFIATVLLI